MPNDVQKICLDSILFDESTLTKTDCEYYVKSARGHIDCFCKRCKESSTFNSDDVGEVDLKVGSDDSLVVVKSFSCARSNCLQRIHFVFMVQPIRKNSIEDPIQFDSYLIIKIGQHPSFAELSDVNSSYEKVLGEDGYKIMRRAYIQESYGFGIGALAYLRRIFEIIVLKARDRAIAANSIVESEFDPLRMREKIEALKDELPDIITEYKDIYSKLSEGIHSLDEKDCMSHFAVLRVGIELALGEELARHKKEKKKEEFERAKNALARNSNAANDD